LPDLDGCELGKRLRERHGKQLFLVAVTAWSDPAHRAAAAAAGFHAYLVKPVKIADVQRVVQSLLATAQPSDGPRSAAGAKNSDISLQVQGAERF
jgi:DNA-binding response OmpR family regulator